MKKLVLTICLLAGIATISKAQTPDGNYASLAIDRLNGNNYGWAVNQPSQAEADKRALEECKKYGDAAHVVLQFKGGCGVYVVERGNPRLYGWGVADTHEEAERIAMEEARAQGGKDLVVRVWGCNEKTLESSEVNAPKVKGVYGFYYLKSSDEKKAFITNMYYEPSAALNHNGSWEWIPTAKTGLSPKAQKFVDEIEENLYGYLSKEMRDKVLTRKPLDWKGTNEVDNLTKWLSIDSYAERKERVENLIEKLKESIKGDGYEIIEISI